MPQILTRATSSAKMQNFTSRLATVQRERDPRPIWTQQGEAPSEESFRTRSSTTWWPLPRRSSGKIPRGSRRDCLLKKAKTIGPRVVKLESSIQTMMAKCCGGSVSSTGVREASGEASRSRLNARMTSNRRCRRATSIRTTRISHRRLARNVGDRARC